MDIVKSFARRAQHSIAVFGALIALVVATLVPGLASAAQLTERSIALSSSSPGVSGASYEVKFTPVATAAAFLIDFCSNDSLSDDACTAPSGLVADTATSTSSGVTDVSATTAANANSVVVTDPLTASTGVDVVLTGIHNPTATGLFYARIISFDTAAHAKAYVAGTTNFGSSGAVDDGGVIMDITDTFGVSAAVMESMSFCVSKTAITQPDCSDAVAPALSLGEAQGSSFALDTTAVSTATMYTQLSTNAAHGAIVSLKSSATNCGGLELAGDTVTSDCFIKPALQTGITAGQAKFGLLLGSPSGGASGQGFEAYPSSGYNGSTYALNAATDNSTGVTSTYGDPLLDTQGIPANAVQIPITFGASIDNNVPAGSYSADLSMIATGTY